MNEVIVAGGGLAGCEAAWYLANKGVSVCLMEMRPQYTTPAHVSGHLGELVCSNSLKSDSLDTAAGLLKAELRIHGSLLMEASEICRVPAGSALAVDRDAFGEEITRRITEHPRITVERTRVTDIPDGYAILACGPLADEKISDKISLITGGKLHFIDAISPVIASDSIDMNKAFFAGRYGKGGDDYLNLPMSEDEFEGFYEALISAETVKAHEFEDEKVFEKCMPIEVIASRGKKTLLFGPMRPVGLTDPRTEKRPFAVVQLRLENRERTAYNIVGFQTKMTIPAQKRVLSLIPGLEKAEFYRYGTIHRNTYIDAPACLNGNQELKALGCVFMAGQITGVEGYLESMASGIMAAIQLYRKMNGEKSVIFDSETSFGALQRHIQGEFGGKDYSPSNFHFGMLPPLESKVRKKSDRKLAYSERALKKY